MSGENRLMQATAAEESKFARPKGKLMLANKNKKNTMSLTEEANSYKR